jgi:DNA polymerase/3'-5' exonuclease PolX
MRMPIEVARNMAEKIVGELEPLCHRIEIAGSIRRGRPFVNDIDLVCIPKDMGALRARCVRNAYEIRGRDAVLSVELATGVQLDVFTAWPEERDLVAFRPSNWGSVLLCRTGSKEHNMYLCQRSKELGLHWNPARGVMKHTIGDEIVACAEEADIFAALKMPWLRPEERER